MNWWVEDKLKKWAYYIDRYTSPELKTKIMEGYKELFPDAELPEIAEWMKNAVARMDKLVDEETRIDIMTSFACEFPAWRIQEFREMYEKSHDLDEILEKMKLDSTMYGPTERQGSTIITTKDPFDAPAFKNARTKEERRLAYCHCMFIKAMKGNISPTFCYCGIGWDRMFWEGIIGKRVKVKVLESVMQGDERCKFSIELPKEITS